MDEAVFYFADFAADDYKDIFNENAVYEISNVASTKFYPVVFTLAEDGKWKIAAF